MKSSQFTIITQLVLLISFSGFAQQSAFFHSGDVKIHYKTAGAGEPVILIHGFTDNMEICFEETIPSLEMSFMERLSKNYQAIAVDARGHGLSDKPTAPEQYGDAMVEDIINLMDHLHLEKAHVVGYSMGGFIVGKLLHAYSNRVLSAVMIGAGPVLPNAWQQEHPLHMLCTSTAKDLSSKQNMNSLLTYFWPSQEPVFSEDSLHALSQQILEGQNVAALSSCIERMPELFALENASAISETITVHAIFGEDDPFAKLWQTEDSLADNSIQIIPKANHMDILSNPSCLLAVEHFLKKAEPSLNHENRVRK